MKLRKLSFLLFLTHASLLGQKIEPSFKSVSYGPHQDMTLNFWKIESSKPVPLLVHIHGGGWLGGKKLETANANELKKGYSFASIDYRLAGVELLPAALHDAARAIQFLRTKAVEWNIDPKHIAVTGGSAGPLRACGLLTMMTWPIQRVMIQFFVNHRGFAEHLRWAVKQLWILFFSKRRSVPRAFGIQ